MVHQNFDVGGATLRVLKVWDAEYPWDVRAEKVMRTLTEAGHTVHLVSRNRRRQPLLEELNEATVHRMKPWAGLGRGIDHASQFPAFFNPRWIGLINRVGRQTRSDLILVRDLPLAPTAIWVGKRLGVPVVLDMAENYGAMMRDLWTSGTRGPFDWAVRNPAIVEAVERWVLRKIDHAVVVVEESGERLRELGLPADKITVVVNTPWPSRIPEIVEPSSTGDAPLRLVYLGLLEAPRGVATVLDAVARLRENHVVVSLDIVGGGRGADDLQRLAQDLELSNHVRFHGVLPYEDALAVVKSADVGLVPHHALESWNTTIPNKLFDYMSNGLAVVTSDAKPAARIVRDVGCGEVFRSEDGADLARALRSVADSTVRDAMATRGRAAVRDRYNWGVDGTRLLRTLEDLI
ncbi:MAG: glycosyltransferase family 4 protein [Longimicrobiales bacterium]